MDRRSLTSIEAAYTVIIGVQALVVEGTNRLETSGEEGKQLAKQWKHGKETYGRYVKSLQKNIDDRKMLHNPEVDSEVVMKMLIQEKTTEVTSDVAAIFQDTALPSSIEDILVAEIEECYALLEDFIREETQEHLRATRTLREDENVFQWKRTICRHGKTPLVPAAGDAVRFTTQLLHDMADIMRTPSLSKASLGSFRGLRYISNDQPYPLTTPRAMLFLSLKPDALVHMIVVKLKRTNLLNGHSRSGTILCTAETSTRGKERLLGSHDSTFLPRLAIKRKALADYEEAAKIEATIEGTYVKDGAVDLDSIREDILSQVDAALSEIVDDPRLDQKFRYVLNAQMVVGNRQEAISSSHYSADLMIDLIMIARYYGAFAKKILPDRPYSFIRNVVRTMEMLASASMVSTRPDVYGLIAAAFLYDRMEILLIKANGSADSYFQFRIFEHLWKVLSPIFICSTIAFHDVKTSGDYWMERVKSIRKACRDTGVSQPEDFEYFADT
ncbi:uncharacterized protein I303_105641 [Kwoniella dejecticola CBS 10117]|uniref:Uncharacterized protein n=1 Tax=Kwoniella dejecticola CBS 10117 TaxID=1296121 RepID=A0A1A6A1Z3_9TREE|nr:uncharacterized protein I303_04915 [Kwoniella dejecticola CBS 10117]OBR84059.1 hypothetical protein I303_04915 [Kwoniella dejecticola CBS 10117]